MVGEETRKTGIDIIGDVSWGTHFCQFYQTKEDLIDILVPYFKAGLENNEFCMWVTSEPLNEQEAEEAIRKAVPDFERYLERGQIEIVPHTEWYLKDGAFDLPRVLNAWINKLNQALTDGYDGVRVSGNTAWLEKRDWRNFVDYEEELNNAISGYQMMAVCTYSLDECGASEVIDVVKNHQFALIRREGKWELMESSERKRAEEEIKRVGEEWRTTFDSITDLVFISDKDLRLVRVNKAFADAFKTKPEALIGKHCYEIVHGTKKPLPNCPHKVAIKAKKPTTAEFFEPYLGIHLEVSTSPIFDDKGEVSGSVHITKDITERKLAEEALRESEEKYRSLVNNVKLGIFRSTSEPTGRFLEVNPAMTEITGYSREELLQMNVADLYVHPEERESILEEIALAKGKAIKEVRNRKKDGTEIVVSDTKVAVRDNAGMILYFDGILEDITERKQTEEYIARLAKFPSENPNPVMRVAQNGTILYANQAALSLLSEWGCQVGQLLPDYLSQSILEVLASGSPKYIEVECGELVFSFMFAPVVDGGYVNLYGRDITERKQAEEALRESEEKLRSMFESIQDGIALIDMAGKVLDVNEAHLRMFGYTHKEELIGQNAFDNITEKDRARVMDGMAKMGEEEPGVPEEYTLRDKNGREFYAEISSVLLRDSSGNPAVVISVIRDVTERKQAEEREKQLQQELYFSSRLASIGELAAGVAHEINNPLAGVLGFSQLLLRKSTSEEARQNLERIHNEGLRVAKIVENLLTFARRRGLKKQYSDINDILQKALELRAYELKTSNIEVSLDLAPTLPKIMVDFGQIQQVFLNIILNAEQVMTETNGGGKLGIKTRRMKNCIRVSFTDDGPGVPAEHLDKLFDPFFTTRGEKGGTGLGLSVSYGIVTEHGGKIYAESKPGEGTTFFVELPLMTEKIDEVKLSRDSLPPE